MSRRRRTLSLVFVFLIVTITAAFIVVAWPDSRSGTSYIDLDDKRATPVRKLTVHFADTIDIYKMTLVVKHINAEFDQTRDISVIPDIKADYDRHTLHLAWFSSAGATSGERTVRDVLQQHADVVKGIDVDE